MRLLRCARNDNTCYNPLIMRPELTDDGSTTFWNEKFQEAYHSRVGAYTEALEKHVQACKIPELAATQNEIKILDLCFGLGYNSAVAIFEATKINPQVMIEIVALENDLEIVQQIGDLKVPQELSYIMRQLSAISKQEPEPVMGLPCFNLTRDNYNLNLIIADAEISLMLLEENYYDAVFYDPFSPKVCPELWHPSFIADVVSKAKPGAYLSTYSSARIAKDGFAAAGCEIFEGPKCGRRDGGVLARKL